MDKWLWQARFFKTRSLAAKTVASGRVRANSDRLAKASAQVGPGDILTFPQGRRIRVVRVLVLGERRGPATEAAALYEDLTPPAETTPAPAAGGDRKGRPTKKERREIDRIRPRALD